MSLRILSFWKEEGKGHKDSWDILLRITATRKDEVDGEKEGKNYFQSRKTLFLLSRESSGAAVTLCKYYAQVSLWHCTSNVEGSFNKL